MRENKASVFRLIVVIETDDKSLFNSSCVCVCVYIYIYRERERERERYAIFR